MRAARSNLTRILVCSVPSFGHREQSAIRVGCPSNLYRSA